MCARLVGSASSVAELTGDGSRATDVVLAARFQEAGKDSTMRQATVSDDVAVLGAWREGPRCSSAPAICGSGVRPSTLLG